MRCVDPGLSCRHSEQRGSELGCACCEVQERELGLEALPQLGLALATRPGAFPKETWFVAGRLKQAAPDRLLPEFSDKGARTQVDTLDHSK